MQIMKWISVLMGTIVIASCFFPWVTIESKNIIIGGFHSTVNIFGKPGLVHLILCSIYIMFLMLNKTWSIRTAFFIGALNIIWAVRNFILISACRGGECPEKQMALYVMLISSVLLPVLILFIDTKQKSSSTL